LGTRIPNFLEDFFGQSPVGAIDIAAAKCPLLIERMKKAEPNEPGLCMTY
jgi:hypothetical protein